MHKIGFSGQPNGETTIRRDFSGDFNTLTERNANSEIQKRRFLAERAKEDRRASTNAGFNDAV